MNFETVLYYKSQQSGTDGPNNGNASKNPPPMSTSSVSTFLSSIEKGNSLRVALTWDFPELFIK